jgi:hypothetical protein
MGAEDANPLAMRVAFVAYLLLILAGLAYASVIGLTHH